MSPHDAGVVGEMLEAFNRDVPGVVVTFDEHCELDAPHETGRFGLVRAGAPGTTVANNRTITPVSR